MERSEAKRELDNFKQSAMSQNPHRAWIGLLLARAAQGDELPSAVEKMLRQGMAA